MAFSDGLPLLTIGSDSEIITIGGTVGVAVDTVKGSTLGSADGVLEAYQMDLMKIKSMT